MGGVFNPDLTVCISQNRAYKALLTRISITKLTPVGRTKQTRQFIVQGVTIPMTALVPNE